FPRYNGSLLCETASLTGTWSSPVRGHLLTREHPQFLLSPFCPPRIEISSVPRCQAFYMGAEELNPGPHTCTAGM
ncbi:mCG144989, partial [Mus musculus]